MKIITRLYRDCHSWRRDLLFWIIGYVWYHDNQHTANRADVQASTLEENNQLGFLREKGCDYCPHAFS